MCCVAVRCDAPVLIQLSIRCLLGPLVVVVVVVGGVGGDLLPIKSVCEQTSC